MSRNNYVYKNVRSVSPYFKQALLQEALEWGVTMSDVIGTLLANHYSESYVLSGNKSIGVELTDQLRFKIPRAVALRINFDARRTGETESSVVLGILAAHYGLIHEPVRKGRKRAVEAA